MKTIRRTKKMLKDAKEKAKMVLVWYFYDESGLCIYRSRSLARGHLRVFAVNPGPIQSALIPAPKPKGKK